MRLPQIVSPPFWYCLFWTLFSIWFWFLGYWVIKWAYIAARKVTG